MSADADEPSSDRPVEATDSGDVGERAAEEQWTDLIFEAGTVLNTSLEFEATVQAVSHLVVPRLADWCTVDVVAEDGSIERLAVTHRDPDKDEAARDLKHRYPVHPSDRVGPAQVIREGRSQLVARIPYDVLRALVRDEEHLRVVRELGFRSVMVLPLRRPRRGRVLGALTLVRAESAVPYRSQDLALAEELALRCALAIDNARLYREAREAQQANEEWLALLGTLSAEGPAGFAFWDVELRYVRVNRALAAMNGLPAHEHVGRSVQEVLGDFGEELASHLRQVLDTGEAIMDLEVSGETPAAPGRMRHWLASCYPLRDRSGTPIGVGAVVNETTQRKESEDRLRRSEQRFRVLVDAAPNGIVAADASGTITLVNPQTEAMFGYSPGELIGEPVERLVPGGLSRSPERDHAGHLRRPAARPMGLARDLRGVRKDGTELPVEISLGPAETDEGPQVTAIIADITERKRLEGELAHQALHDPLTGLPNRTLFRDRLEHALEVGRRTGLRPALLMVDVDHFKDINDTLGHEAGDELLVALGPRVRTAMRASDTVGRLGGDEFAVLCEGCNSEHDAVALAERLRGAWATSFTVAGREVLVTATTGIALPSDQATDAGVLVRQADAAMYRAKEAGRGGHELYDERMRERSAARRRTETDLRGALERDELHIAYQPIVDPEKGSAVGVEALLRWEHPRRGPIAPAEFVPLAEDTGLIVPIGRWVLEQACSEVAAWQREDPSCAPLELSVNLSARQLTHDDIVGQTAQSLAASGLDAKSLGVEITESVVMDQSSGMLNTLAAIRGLGVRLLLDDFGTGYSSLSYLERFAPDALKVDRSFVQALEDEGRPHAVVEAIVKLAQALGMSVVAEGVETERQRDAIRGMGCDRAQGYLFARPLPPAEAQDWVCRRAG